MLLSSAKWSPKVIWSASLKPARTPAKIAARTALRQALETEQDFSHRGGQVIDRNRGITENRDRFHGVTAQILAIPFGRSFEGAEMPDGSIAPELADEWSSHDGVNLAEWREYVTAGPAVDDDAVRAALMAEENAVCPICGRTFREAVAHVDDGNAPCFAGCHLPDETPPGRRSRHAARPTMADRIARAEYGDDEDEWERWKQRDDVKIGGAR